MSGKPRLFLLDAGPVIALHELGLWERFLRRTTVIVPAVVAHRETTFWPAAEGVGHPIDLRRDAARGLLEVPPAGAAAVAAVLAGVLGDLGTGTVTGTGADTVTGTVTGTGTGAGTGGGECRTYPLVGRPG